MMDCVITAGGIPQPDDPLYAYTQGKPKALLEINGRLLLDYVVTAVQGATSIDHIVVVGLAEPPENLPFADAITFLPNHGGLLSNVLAGIDWLCEHRALDGPLLLSSSDIPALTSAMVDDFVATCRPYDRSVYYNFITRDTLETRYPHSNRTYVKLKGVEIAGGDLLLVHSELRRHTELWEAMINGRKQAWKLASLVGWRTLLKLLTRQLSLSDIEALTERLLGKRGKIILNPHAEIAMDIDKVNQLELLMADMGR